MAINHINLCASDVAKLSALLVEHFDFAVLQSGKVPEGTGLPGAGGQYAFLTDPNGFYIVISQIDHKSGSAYPPGFHFATMLKTPDAVALKHAQLQQAGFVPGAISEFEAMGSRWSAFYFDAGDGLTIEVNTSSSPITELSAD